MNIWTWNMRGCDQSNDNRWTSTVASFFQAEGAKADVVLLQECGAAPASALLNPVQDQKWLPAPPANPVGCSYGLWSTGSSERAGGTRYLFHAHWDVGGNRCNLAIVSRDEPFWLAYFPNPLNPTERPAIGIVHGSAGHMSLIVSLHAFSGNGNDGPVFMSRVSDLAELYGIGWFLGGDYNRQPVEWPLPPPGTAPFPWFVREVTFPSSRSIFDYAWSDSEARFNPQVHSTVTASDHYPVSFYNYAP